jgi:hypothetical protein
MLKLPPCPRLLAASSIAAVALALYVAVGPSRSAQAEEKAPPENPAWKDYLYLGADTCKRCHVMPVGDKPEFVKLTEYTTWKTTDKHSIAYAVLEGSLGRRIGKALGGDEKFVLKPEAGCLGCHSMHFPGRTGEQFNPKDGVSCDGCHGPSLKWLAPHFAQKDEWRKKTPQQKHAEGMRDLRNPAERARLCSSCHVGSPEEGRVVTHAMYAAGHPLLTSFEVATFSHAEPQHWYDKKDVPLFKEKRDQFKDLYDLDDAAFQNTRLVLAGAAASLRQQTGLVAGRAASGDKWPELKLPALAEEKDAKALWPQAAMGHSDCAACHHELRVPSWRAERGYGLTLLDGTLVRGRPGRPQPRLWSLPLASLALRPDDAKPLNAALTDLHAACDARPFGDLDVVGKAAAARDAVNLKQAAAVKLDEAAATDLLKRLTALAQNRTLDFDAARQLAAAFIVIYTELHPKPGNDAGVRDIIAALQRDLDLDWTASLEERRKLVTKRIETALGRKVETEAALQQALVEVDKDKLREALLDKDHIDAMQKLRDQELAATLRKMAQFDPATFRERMKKLHELVAGTGSK